MNSFQMPLPQVVAINGQYYYVAANQHSFLTSRSFLEAQLQQQTQQQQLQLPAPESEPEPEPVHEHEHELEPEFEFESEPEPEPSETRIQPSPEKIERIKAKTKNIKGDFISHYIDSQLIIETPEPFKEKKKKKKKRKIISDGPIITDITQSMQEQQAPGFHLVPQSQTSPLAKSAASRDSSTIDSLGDVDILRLREEMRSWSVSKVVEFIESHEAIKQYSSKFAEDEIDGTALLYMIDRNLNLQVLSTMFKYGPAMKIEATLSKYKLKE